MKTLTFIGFCLIRELNGEDGWKSNSKDEEKHVIHIKKIKRLNYKNFKSKIGF